MKNLSRHPGVMAFALLLGLVIGCKSTTTNTTTSTSNTNSQNSNSSANKNSSTSNAAPPNIAGKYNVTGSNPNGTNYKGTLEVIARGDVYQFRWNAGTQYDGVGIQNGNII